MNGLKNAARRPRAQGPGRWTAPTLIGIVWLAVIALAVGTMRGPGALPVAAGAFLATGLTFAIAFWADRARRAGPIEALARSARDAQRNGDAPRDGDAPSSEAERLPDPLAGGAVPLVVERPASWKAAHGRAAASEGAVLTRSGLFDAPRLGTPGVDATQMSGTYSTTDMVNRLEPSAWHWIESSPAEQIFFGWTLEELQDRSFLDVVHPDDRGRAEAALRQTLDRGEGLGLVVRVRTAHGRTRAVEVNAGARYGTNQRVVHVRCHLADVTEKMLAERQLRVRTRELVRVNEQLRDINRELEDLKDRYGDLYENAPAMYFSLDRAGCVVECNQTMLEVLGRPRAAVVGRPFQEVLQPSCWESFRAGFDELLEKGAVEVEMRWPNRQGEVIDVGAVGQVVGGARCPAGQVRFVAQDITAKRRLEAELREKHQHLARANEALSRKNRELDQFVYVVSHDLQEPLRTLIAFSDFLLTDYGERLEPEGREHVRYLVEASRRMRAMIQGLLCLSRAGKVIGEFGPVDLNELVPVIKTDLGELVRRKNAEVRVVGRLPRVWGDRDRIGQLLANLIANGLKYNQSRNPLVEIGSIPPAVANAADGAIPNGSGEAAVITVKDNGIGIDPQFHQTIFQLFRRLHSPDDYEGTGAGLAISEKIVQAHGGRIRVESALGAGATFWIELPRPPLERSSTLLSSLVYVETTTTISTQAAQDEHDAV